MVPVGATTPIPVDACIVAATNRDLGAGVVEHRFRGDLYARLARLEVRLPPLRDCREDVLLLLLHALGGGAWRLTPGLAEALLLHPWPFNVREVFSIAQLLRIRAAGTALLDLPQVADRLGLGSIPPGSTPARPSPPTAAAAAPGADDEDDDGGPAPDRAGLEVLLEAHGGVVAEVARVVRRSRKQVYRWIAKHGIDMKRYRGDG